MRLSSGLLSSFVLVCVVGLAFSCTNTVEILNPAVTPDPGDEPPITQDNPVDPPQDDPVVDPPQDDPVDDPQPLNISGSWDTYATVANDTCGFEPPEPYAPILVEEAGDGVTVTVNDGTGVCEASTRSRFGDTLTLTRSDVLDLDGAFVRIDTNIVYDFTEDSFSGTVSQSFTDLSGVFVDLPCEITLTVTGTRCDNCWTGCTSTTQVAKSGGRNLGFEEQLRKLAAH